MKSEHTELTRREFVAAASAMGLVLPARAAGELAIPGKLNFLVVGDWGRDGTTYQRHVAYQMGQFGKLIDSQFTVSTGDNFYKLGVSSPFDRQWATSFEDIYTAPALQQPWYAVLGNHDYGGRVEGQIKRTSPTSRWQMRHKWFDVGPAELGRSDTHLFFIDSVLWLGKESFPYRWLGSSIDQVEAGEQRKCVGEALRQSKARHKLVFGHHPIYSVGPHGGVRPNEQLQELDGLLRETGVTAYVCGHDHCLYHIKFEGMDYVCSGGGSQELREYRGDPKVYGCVYSDQCPPSGPTWHSYFDRAGFAAFSISNDGVDFSFIDRDGLMTPYTRLQRPHQLLTA